MEQRFTVRTYCHISASFLVWIIFVSVMLFHSPFKAAIWDTRPQNRLPPPAAVMKVQVDVKRSVDISPDNSSSSAKFPTLSEHVRSLPRPTSRQTIVLTTTNKGFMDFTKNMLLSIMKTGVRPNVTIIAEDEASLEALSSNRYPRLQVVRPDSDDVPSEGAALAFDSHDYNQFINRRPKYVLEFVSKGFEVFFVDADTFWFRNPFNFFDSDFDIACVKDSPKIYNAGVVYYKPTELTISFLKAWVLILETQKKLRQDQEVMNLLLSSDLIPGLRVKRLEDRVFPSGRYFFRDFSKCKARSKKTALFHAAFIPGHAKKLRMFKKCHVWLNK